MQKGLTFTMIRDVSGYAAYFTTIFYCQRYFEQIGLSPIVGSFIAGAIVRVFHLYTDKKTNIQLFVKSAKTQTKAGANLWTVALPADTLKSRQQTDFANQYKSLSDVVKSLMKQEGMGGLYRGFVPTIIRSLPVNSVCFLAYDVSMKYLTQLRGNSSF